MILGHYFWRLWRTDADNGLLIIPILVVLTAILIYAIDFIAKKIKKKWFIKD